MKLSRKIAYFIVIICITALFFSNVAIEPVYADDDYRYESATFKYKDVKFTINGEKQSAWKYHEEKMDDYYDEETDRYVEFVDQSHIFYLDGKYIYFENWTFDGYSYYKNGKKLNPEKGDWRKLASWLKQNYSDQIDKAISKKAESLIGEYGDTKEEVEEYLRSDCEIKEGYTDRHNESCVEQLIEYSGANNEKKLKGVVAAIEKTNKYDFNLPISVKEQKLKLGIKYKDTKLTGEYTQIGSDKVRIKVTGYTGIRINSFGEPVGLEDYAIDSRVKLSGTDIVVPAGWTGYIRIELANFRNGSNYTEDVLDYGVYISSGVAALDSDVSLYENETTGIQLAGQADNITYKSSDKKVAVVSKKGIIKGVGTGTTDILILKNRVQVSSVRVHVYESHLMTTRLLLEPDEKHKLCIRGTDAKIKSVKSSDTSVATVSKKGVVKAKKNGTATITVTDTNGKKYTCKVYVWISVHDVQEKLMKDIPADHDLGAYWDGNSSYHGWKGGNVTPGEYACGGYAAYLSDVIMGDAKAYYYKDIYGLLPGDVAIIYNEQGGSHAEVVVDVDYSRESEGIIRYYMWSGNYNWSVLDSDEIVGDFWRIGIENMSERGFKRVISRYDDSICKRKVK